VSRFLERGEFQFLSDTELYGTGPEVPFVRVADEACPYPQRI
jgi:hypothetical protein